MSDTPRTDEHATPIGTGPNESVSASFARRLERELQAAKAEIERLKDACERTKCWIERGFDDEDGEEIYDCLKTVLQDGRAVTGGSNIEEKDGSPCATVESSASEERDSSSPSVDNGTAMKEVVDEIAKNEYLRGFRDAKEMAAKVKIPMPTDEDMEQHASWIEAYDLARFNMQEAIRAIEPGE